MHSVTLCPQCGMEGEGGMGMAWLVVEGVCMIFLSKLDLGGNVPPCCDTKLKSMCLKELALSDLV